MTSYDQDFRIRPCSERQGAWNACNLFCSPRHPARRRLPTGLLQWPSAPEVSSSQFPASSLADLRARPVRQGNRAREGNCRRPAQGTGPGKGTQAWETQPGKPAPGNPPKEQPAGNSTAGSRRELPAGKSKAGNSPGTGPGNWPSHSGRSRAA